MSSAFRENGRTKEHAEDPSPHTGRSIVGTHLGGGPSNEIRATRRRGRPIFVLAVSHADTQQSC